MQGFTIAYIAYAEKCIRLNSSPDVNFMQDFVIAAINAAEKHILILDST